MPTDALRWAAFFDAEDCPAAADLWRTLHALRPPEPCPLAAYMTLEQRAAHVAHCSH